jgi:hypothetical protein
MRPPIAPIFALLAVTGTAYGQNSGSTPAQPNTAIAPAHRGTAVPMPKGTPRRPIGIPAIAMHAGANPPFSKDDVATFIRTHGLPMNDGPAASLQVDNLEFIRSAEVTARLDGEATGLNDDDMVAFATISGPLAFSGPPPAHAPVTFTQGYAVFDATTGNLLMVGTLSEK